MTEEYSGQVIIDWRKVVATLREKAKARGESGLTDLLILADALEQGFEE